MYAWDISHALKPCITHIAMSLVLLLSTWRRSYASSALNNLVTATKLKLSQTFNSNVTFNSDLTLAATTLEYLDRRGECKVPKRYLKEADWCKDGTLGAGYYIANLDDPSILILVDFNFKNLQWGCTHQKKDKFILERPAPVGYRLCIFDEERMQDRSHWGPLDRTPDEDESPDTNFKFGSDTGGDTPDPDIIIPRSQREEIDIATLAQLIPSHISKPPIQPWSLAGEMAQIASTTTLSESLVAWTLGTGVSQQGNTASAEGILRTIFPSQYNWEDGSGDDPPEPNCHDLYTWMDFLFLSLCSLFHHHLCYCFGLWFVDSYLITHTVLLWLTLGYRS